MDTDDLEKIHRVDVQRRIVSLAIETIGVNPYQPRKVVKKSGINELATSIAQEGLLEPILVAVSPKEKNTYLLVAGQRRLLAVKHLNFSAIEAIIVANDRIAEIALIENLQREDLTPIEEAEALQNLMKLEHQGEKRYKNQGELAKAVGVSRVNVNRLLRLNSLPDVIKTACRSGQSKVSKSALVELVTMNDPNRQLTIWAQLEEGTDNIRKIRREKGTKSFSRSNLTPLDRVETTSQQLIGNIEKLGKVSSQITISRLEQIRLDVSNAIKSSQ